MLRATPHCPVAPQSPALLALGARCLPAMLAAAPSPAVPKAPLCPSHLLTLLILPQVEGPFGQGQPILVNLGQEMGTG